MEEPHRKIIKTGLWEGLFRKDNTGGSEKQGKLKVVPIMEAYRLEDVYGTGGWDV